MFPKSYFTPFIALLLLLPDNTSAQCSATCPPLESGVPVASLCQGDVFSSSQSSTSYSTCYPSTGPASINFADLAISYDFIVVANYFVGCNAGRRESGVYAYSSQVGNCDYELSDDELITSQ